MLFFDFFEQMPRAINNCLEMLKRAFENKEARNPFLKTVKIFSVSLHTHIEFKMTLDTGCDLNLISTETVRELDMLDDMEQRLEDVGVCLNGGSLSSVGTITLRWKGKGKYFRRIFTTTFYVIEGDFFPWQVILGSNTITKYGILMFAGFGSGRLPVLPKESKEQKLKESKRKDEAGKEAAANDFDRNADIRRRDEEIARERFARDKSSSSGSQKPGEPDDKK